MARPIKETPVLKGKDVERFKYNLEHPTPVSAEEVTKARETYEKFKKLQTDNKRQLKRQYRLWQQSSPIRPR